MRGFRLMGKMVVPLSVLCAVLLSQGACATSNTGDIRVSAALSTTVTVPAVTSTTEPAPIEITIAAGGDVMVSSLTLRVARGLGDGDGYDFKPMVSDVAPYIRMADYAVVNLETTMAGSGYGYAGYPKFNTPVQLTEALALCGIDLCATANNHCFDRGMAGITGTLDRLDQAGISHVGTYRSAEEKDAPFIVDIKGIKVAFICYTNMINQGLPGDDYSVNYLSDPTQAAADAQAAREAGAEIVIAILHWGREYATTPSNLQTGWAKGTDEAPGLLASGVDVVLGAHPHVVQPAARVTYQTGSGPKNAYVVYSLGNLLSDMHTPPLDRGAIVYVHISKIGEKVEVMGLSYIGVMIDRIGSYVRGIEVVPVLPGVAPAADVTVSASRQERLASVWDYLTDMLYDPDTNIIPLDPLRLPTDASPAPAAE